MTLEEMHEQRGDYVAGCAAGRGVAGRQRARAGERRHRRPRPDQPRIFRPVQRLRRRRPDPLTEIDRDAPQDAQRDRAATLVEIRNQNLETQRACCEIDRDSEYARLEQEREVEVRRAVQRAELASERALRDQEARAGADAGAEAVEKSRIAQERNIAEERIGNEEDTQRREIARRRALERAS